MILRAEHEAVVKEKDAMIQEKDGALKEKEHEIQALRARLASQRPIAPILGQSLDRARSASVDPRNLSGFEAELDKRRRQREVASAVSRRRSYSEQRRQQQQASFRSQSVERDPTALSSGGNTKADVVTSLIAQRRFHDRPQSAPRAHSRGRSGERESSTQS
mmetsp:Transcript_33509/g.57450  ORF Transcript_33509/g.57450 Transcript_33509/m.57450 type:complete len:162 (-) Transcript_33509:177-662(-)